MAVSKVEMAEVDKDKQSLKFIKTTLNKAGLFFYYYGSKALQLRRYSQEKINFFLDSHLVIVVNSYHAGMAELVYARALGARSVRIEGSSPSSST